MLQINEIKDDPVHTTCTGGQITFRVTQKGDIRMDLWLFTLFAAMIGLATALWFMLISRLDRRE